jgi:hypothetical protein
VRLGKHGAPVLSQRLSWEIKFPPEPADSLMKSQPGDVLNPQERFYHDENERSVGPQQPD